MFIKSDFFSFKALFCAFSFVGHYIFLMQHPAVVTHHICIPSTLIPSLHFLNNLVNLSPCSSLTAPRFSRK